MHLVLSYPSFMSPQKLARNKGLLHGYEWGLRFGGLELRFG